MSLRREMKRVQDLARITGSVREARALLADLGVPEKRGFFARQAFLDALAGRRASVPPPASRKSDAVDCVRDALQPLGIRVARASLGKSVVVWLTAADEVRVVRSDDFGFEPLVIDSEPVATRVNVVGSRQSGAPHFSASLAGGSEKIFCFVLLSERRTWLARRDELEAIEKWLEHPKHAQRSGMSGVGFALHGIRPRTLRAWMPISTGTGLDPSSRIATADGRLLGAREGGA
jgi:hypothetical protein